MRSSTTVYWTWTGGERTCVGCSSYLFFRASARAMEMDSARSTMHTWTGYERISGGQCKRGSAQEMALLFAPLLATAAVPRHESATAWTGYQLLILAGVLVLGHEGWCFTVSLVGNT